MFHQLFHTLLLAIIFNGVHAQPFYFGADLSYVNEMEACGAVYKADGTPRNVYGLFQEKELIWSGFACGIHLRGMIS